MSPDFLPQLLSIYKDVKYSGRLSRPRIRFNCDTLDELLCIEEKEYFLLLVLKLSVFLMLTFPDISFISGIGVHRVYLEASRKRRPLRGADTCALVLQVCATQWAEPGTPLCKGS